MEVVTLGKKPGDMENVAVLTCWNTLVQLQPETVDDTIRDAETEVLVNTQADTLAWWRPVHFETH